MKWFRRELDSHNPDEKVLASIGFSLKRANEIIRKMRAILLASNPSDIFVGDYMKDLENFSKLVEISHLIADADLRASIERIYEVLPNYLIIRQLEMHKDDLLRMQRTIRERGKLDRRQISRLREIINSVEGIKHGLSRDQDKHYEINRLLTEVIIKIAYVDENK